MRHALVLFALTLAAFAAQAKPACYADPVTAAYTCWDDALVTENSGLRYSPLYTGGPKGIDRTGFEIAVNCGTGVMHLKDSKGVSFGGGHRGDTAVATSTIDGMCAAKLKR